jgi:hypothetical protein
MRPPPETPETPAAAGPTTRRSPWYRAWEFLRDALDFGLAYAVVYSVLRVTLIPLVDPIPTWVWAVVAVGLVILLREGVREGWTRWKRRARRGPADSG